MSPPNTSHRLAELDGLRGVAALSVVLFHYTHRFHALNPSYPGHHSFAITYGHCGVELFFMISGFVIYMTLAKTNSAWEFAKLRFSRLYPGFWCGVALTLIVCGTLRAPYANYAPSAVDVAINLTMLQRIVPGCQPVDGAYWSLTVEVMFYGLICALRFSPIFATPRKCVAFFLVAAVCVNTLETSAFHTNPITKILQHIFLYPYTPYFCIGMAAYSNFVEGAANRKKNIAAILASLITILLLRTATDAAVSLALTAAFLAAAHSQLPILRTRPFTWLGAISYSLYVVHQNIGYSLMDWLATVGTPFWAAVCAAVSLAITIATAVTLLVERPAQSALRRLLLPSRQHQHH